VGPRLEGVEWSMGILVVSTVTIGGASDNGLSGLLEAVG